MTVAVTTEIWYVDDNRQVVDFSVVIINNVAQVKIRRAKGELNTSGSSPTVGDLSYTLFANAGDTVSPARIASAVAEKSTKALPVAPSNSGGGSGAAGVDAVARAAAQEAKDAAQTALTAAGNAQSAADGAVNSASSAQSAATSASTVAGNAQTSADKVAASVSSLLFLQARDPDVMLIGSVTRSGNGTVTGFNVLWPDGATGVFAGAPSLTMLGYVDSYTITHVLNGATKTFTQPSIVRDPVTGGIVSRPAITVADGAPVVPIIPTATIITATPGTAGSGQITVSSTGGSNISSRAIYRSTSVNPIASGSVVGSVVPYVDSTVTAKVTYYYQEVVTSSTGATAASNIVTSLVAPTPIIPVADTLVAAAGADGSGQITVTGSGASNADSVAIYRSTSTPVSTSSTPVAASLPFVDTELTNGVAYYYVEVATSTTGDTATSNTVNATVANAPAPADTLTVTLGTATVTTQPLTYTTVANSTAYSIEHKTSSGSTWIVDTTTATGTSFTVTALTPNTSYDYRVRGSNANGYGPYSSIVTGSTPADTVAPTPPTIVNASAGNQQVTLTFSGATDNVGVTSYRVYDAASSGNLVTTGASSPIVVTGLTNNTAYTFYVSAADAATNESGRTASNTATPVNETVIFSDTFDRADTTGGGTVGNSWADSSNAFAVKSNSLAPQLSSATSAAYYLMRPTPAAAGSLLRLSINNKITGSYGSSGTTSRFGLVLCASSASTFTDRYAFGYTSETGAWNINKLVTGQSTVTLGSGTALTTTPPYAIKVGFKTATVLAIWINGIEIGNASDSSPLTGRYYGISLFGSLASPSTINNMRGDDFIAVTA